MVTQLIFQLKLSAFPKQGLWFMYVCMFCFPVLHCMATLLLRPSFSLLLRPLLSETFPFTQQNPWPWTNLLGLKFRMGLNKKMFHCMQMLTFYPLHSPFLSAPAINQSNYRLVLQLHCITQSGLVCQRSTEIIFFPFYF